MAYDITGSSTTSDVAGLIVATAVAALPGILVALLSHYLTQRREDRKTQQMIANARMLLALEMERNRVALATFWRTINDLDKERTATSAEGHLAAMAHAGLLMQTLPHWSFVRWEGISAEAIASLRKQNIEDIDQAYRDLRSATDLYAQLVTLIPEERELLDKDRFWYNRYAGMRLDTFERLTAVANRLLAAPTPLADKSRL